ncbi:MAG TPA: hypothetical protein GX505_13050 [Clostridiales bacterium]|nr:hypothetical protein [Clostridiales bacterium]
MVDVNKIEEYQNLLNRIPGIISSRIVASEDGNLSEIHILSDISRGPKQIVRDVQSALLASCNLSIDHKIVSVAQVESSQLGTREFRLSIDSIHLSTRQGKVEASVVLRNDDITYEGNAAGGNSAQSRLRVVAEAALKALHQYLNKEYVFILSDAVKISLGDRKAIALSVIHITDKGEEYLCGSAFIQYDDYEAAVKATLDAVNRRLSRYNAK